MQGAAPAELGVVATGPTTTHELWHFMACVSQLIVQVVNADTDGSNWGRGIRRSAGLARAATTQTQIPKSPRQPPSAAWRTL
jgi:hypothetical protein